MRSKKQVKNIGRVLLLFVGLSILLYPWISNRWNEQRNKELMANYRNTLHKEDTSEVDAELKAAQGYNATLYEPSVPDAFSIRDGITDKKYESLLNMGGDGIMAYVEIPVIEVLLPIYHYTTDSSLERGAGHLLGSSLPVGGAGTHSVISAHRGLPRAKMFTDLNLLKVNDLFYIHVLGETLAYETDQILTVEPHETKTLGIDPGKDYVTLVTCTPYAVNTHRILVRGHRVPYEHESYTAAAAQPGRQDKARLLGQIISAIAGLFAAGIIVFAVSRADKSGVRKQGVNTNVQQ